MGPPLVFFSPFCGALMVLLLMPLPGCEIQGPCTVAGHMCDPEKSSIPPTTPPQEGALSLTLKGQVPWVRASSAMSRLGNLKQVTQPRRAWSSSGLWWKIKEDMLCGEEPAPNKTH